MYYIYHFCYLCKVYFLYYYKKLFLNSNRHLPKKSYSWYAELKLEHRLIQQLIPPRVVKSSENLMEPRIRSNAGSKISNHPFFVAKCTLFQVTVVISCVVSRLTKITYTKLI